MYLSRTFLFSALPLLALATTMARPPTSNGISLPLVKRGGHSGPIDPDHLVNGVRETVAKIHRGLTAYEKNTGKRHPLADGIKTLTKRDNGTADLTRVNATGAYGVSNTKWTVRTKIGGKEFDLEPDLGSANSFVTSTGCNSKPCKGRQAYYNATSSHNPKFTITYDDHASVKGWVVTDKVNVAGVEVDHKFGAATEYPQSLSVEHFPADGRLGLAFSGASNSGLGSFIEDIAGKLSSKLFAFSFNASTGTGLFELGGIDPAVLYLSPVNTTTTNSLWALPCYSIKMDGTPLNIKDGGTNLIIDSATDMVIGPPDYIRQLIKAMPNSQQLHGGAMNLVSCFFASGDAAVTFVLQDVQITIQISALNLGPSPDHKKQDLCIIAVSASPALTDKFLIIPVASLDYYTVFSMDNNTISFGSLG